MIDAATLALNNKSGMETTLTSSVEVGQGLQQPIESNEIIFKNLLHSLFKPEMEIFTDEGSRQLVEAEVSLPAGNILPPLLELLTDDIDTAELIKVSSKDDLTSGKGILQSPVSTQVLSLLDDVVLQGQVLKPVNNFSNVNDYYGRLLHKEVQILDQPRNGVGAAFRLRFPRYDLGAVNHCRSSTCALPSPAKWSCATRVLP